MSRDGTGRSSAFIALVGRAIVRLIKERLSRAKQSGGQPSMAERGRGRGCGTGPVLPGCLPENASTVLDGFLIDITPVCNKTSFVYIKG